jgi:uncharacterized membrane protein YhaH (DUF805 family)
MQTQLDPNNPYAPPTADFREAPIVKLTWTKILFAFEGRLPRRLYWATRGLAMLPLVLAGVLGAIIGKEELVTLLVIPAYFVCVWIALAGSVKRWHDLDKSGFWIFIAMVPLVGGFWELIEAGCTRGTSGPNRYGPDPT